MFVHTITVNTLYQLCTVVDQGSVVPPGWQTVWTNIPASGKQPNNNFAAVFQLWAQSIIVLDVFDGPFSTPLPVYVVAIQGTNDKKEIIQDFEVKTQVPFEPISGAWISKGSSDALSHVLNLKDVSSGGTLQSFLAALPKESVLVATGHSLGGNIASVMTPWIAANLPQFKSTENGDFPVNLGAVTFAAPTAGNSAFAAFLDTQKRYAANFNLNDVVPQVWAQTGPLRMGNIAKLFPSPGPTGAPCDVIRILFDFVSAFAETGIEYTQTRGTMFSFPSAAPPTGKSPEDQWLWELGYQHNDAYAAQFGGSASPENTT